jgi:alpha-galactosidase
VRKLSDDKRSILMNADVIAIDQDASATAADRVRNDSRGVQLWARELSGGDKAVLLFNGGWRHLSNVSVSWAEIGWDRADKVVVRDLWARRDLGVFAGEYAAPEIARRDVALLRLSKQSQG